MQDSFGILVFMYNLLTALLKTGKAFSAPFCVTN